MSEDGNTKEHWMNLFEKVLNPKCPDCGTELAKYAWYDDRGAFRICPKCKAEVRE